ncbi:hypothetical protein E4U53_001868, partial [Claviceps sorghi]
MASMSVSDECLDVPVQTMELEKQKETVRHVHGTARRPSIFDHIDEKKVLRKMDLRLLPMLSLLYLLCYLDRGNIGNAEVEGLSKTLNILPNQYNWCLTVFFFTYAAFEVPSNLLLKKLRPSRWLSTIMVAWGLVMTLMGLVQNYHGLLIARLFLGVAEAGLFPGVIASTQVGQSEEFSWTYVWQLFRDWQVWVYVFVFWGILCPLYGVSLFLPSILKNLDYSNTQAQLLTVPIYVTASVVAVIVAFFSDRLSRRSPFVMGMMLMMVVGFIMCIATSNPHVVYGGVFIATCGIYSAYPGVTTLISNNLAGSYKRSAGIAFEIGVGNLGG